MDDRLLSPSEAALLIAPSASTGGQCIQVALLTLLGHGHLAFEDTGKLFREPALRLLKGDGADLPPHVSTVKHTLTGLGKGDFLRRSEVVQALQSQFGLSHGRYVHDHVAPALIARGLLHREVRRFLGLVPYRRYTRTSRGEERARPLLRLMDQLKTMRKLLAERPEEAVRLAREAGVLLVISSDARRQIKRLKDFARDSGAEGGTVAVAYHSDSSDASDELGVELGNFDLSDLDLFSGVDVAGDFTDGGGSDGGDGGGGD